MKIATLIFTLVVELLISSSRAFYVVETTNQCFSCMTANSDNYVCRNNFMDKVSYCCENDEDDEVRHCKNNDFCSDDVEDQAMQAVTCPYEYKMCGNYNSAIVLDEVNTITSLQLERTVQYKFVDASICYYEIYADANRYQLDQADFKITVIFKQMDQVVAQIINGTSRFDADDAVTIDYDRIFTFDAINNRIFVILTGQEDDDNDKLKDPGEFEIELDFWLNAPPEQEVVIEETKEDGSIEQVTIVNGTISEVIVIWTDPAQRERIPQTKLTILICLFSSSILIYSIYTWYGKKRNQKRKVQQIENEALTTQDVYARTISILIRRDKGIALDDSHLQSEKFQPNMDTVKEYENYDKGSHNNDSIELPKLDKPFRIEEQKEFDLNQRHRENQRLRKNNEVQSEMDDVSLPALNMSPQGRAINKLALSQLDDINAQADLDGAETQRNLLNNDKKIKRHSMQEQRVNIPRRFDSIDLASSKSPSGFQVRLSVKDGQSSGIMSKEMGKFGTEEHTKQIMNRISNNRQNTQKDRNTMIPEKGSFVSATNEPRERYT